MILLKFHLQQKLFICPKANTEFLVSVAGAGIMIGAVVNTLFAKKLSTNFLIGAGSVGVSLGYLLYACSSSFQTIGAGFFSLSFALAFASAGFQTFYQNSIPVDMMGRVGSIYGLLESLLIIIMTFFMRHGCAHLFDSRSCNWWKPDHAFKYNCIVFVHLKADVL